MSEESRSRSSLDRAYAVGSGAWPDLELEPRDFTDFLESMSERHGTLIKDERRFADLFLVAAVLMRIPRATERFSAHVGPAIRGALSPLDIDRGAIDDIEQQLLIRLLVGDGEREPLIVDYAGRGDLLSWIRVTALRMGLNSLRSTGREQPLEEDEIDDLQSHSDPELGAIRERYRDAFKEAFQAAVSALPTKDRLLLRQHLIDGLTIDDIGALHRIHRVTAARWLQRIREQLRAATHAEVAKRVGVSGEELRALWSSLQSQFDASVSRVLRGD